MELLLALLFMAFLGGYAAYTVVDIIIDIRRERKLIKKQERRRMLRNAKTA